MAERLTPQEVAFLIRGRQILKEKGLAKDADVKSICAAAGVSRKTGYEWAKALDVPAGEGKALREEVARLKVEHEELKERHERLEWENEGRKVAWQLHEVDKLLAAKKNSPLKPRKR